MKLDQDWKKSFYDPEYNIALAALESFFKWVLVSLPDLSLVLGTKRYIANFFVIMLTIAAEAWVLFSGDPLLLMAIKFYLVSFIPCLAFSKSWASAMLYALEKYKSLAKKMLINPENVILDGPSQG